LGTQHVQNISLTGIASAIPFIFFLSDKEEDMIELLKFIFAVVFLVIAFKLAIGFLKVALWLFGVLLLVSAFVSIFGG
jgi:hypothetical protein